MLLNRVGIWYAQGVGLALTIELPWHGLPTVGLDGTRLQPRLPKVLKLANGDYRAYFDCGCSGAAADIVSALSHDLLSEWRQQQVAIHKCQGIMKRKFRDLCICCH